ncbi:hypothetical protein QAD02_010104 [Eretmocerus hayati]|uniref:Uncharacterized protein n=1 Tax=Eretmocerus hayati TaxID=131215 RepID=A0ACC2NCJ6_9HYME|nr:hypothetical protein QAD02_010104 [Eretmocerus hayati]
MDVVSPEQRRFNLMLALIREYPLVREEFRVALEEQLRVSREIGRRINRAQKALVEGVGPFPPMLRGRMISQLHIYATGGDWTLTQLQRLNFLIAFLLWSCYKAAYAVPNPQTTPKAPVTIPDSLNAEEKRILADQERINENIRQLEEKMRYEMSRPHSPVQPRPFQGVIPGPSSRLETTGFCTDQNRLPPIEKLKQLHSKKLELKAKLQRLTILWQSFQVDGEPRYGAGPCNGESDEPYFSGMSRRMMMAGFEAMDMNYCNLAIEAREELSRVEAEIARMESKE